ncbi:MAG: hypothetical protein DMG61_04365 [Acidobacteria bacterium]|nr:MAG: hypothetical protein DMG61_04365 [Acidobacteriota bacterium]
MDTGEILAVAEGKGESKRESTSMLGGGGSWHGFGGGNADFGSSDFQNTIIGEAVKSAVEQTSTQVIADKDKLQVRQVVVEGLVAAVDGGQIILNVGAKAGVKVGDQLSVERVSREIKDPASGKVIRRIYSFGKWIQDGRRGENGHAITWIWKSLLRTVAGVSILEKSCLEKSCSFGVETEARCIVARRATESSFRTLTTSIPQPNLRCGCARQSRDLLRRSQS